MPDAPDDIAYRIERNTEATKYSLTAMLALSLVVFNKIEVESEFVSEKLSLWFSVFGITANAFLIVMLLGFGELQKAQGAFLPKRHQSDANLFQRCGDILSVTFFLICFIAGYTCPIVAMASYLWHEPPLAIAFIVATVGALFACVWMSIRFAQSVRHHKESGTSEAS